MSAYRAAVRPQPEPPDPVPLPGCVHCGVASIGYDRAKREGRCYWHEKIARLASIDESLRKIADAAESYLRMKGMR